MYSLFHFLLQAFPWLIPIAGILLAVFLGIEAIVIGCHALVWIFEIVFDFFSDRFLLKSILAICLIGVFTRYHTEAWWTAEHGWTTALTTIGILLFAMAVWENGWKDKINQELMTVSCIFFAVAAWVLFATWGESAFNAVPSDRR